MWWNEHYDVVIAGSGLGAAALAHRLARDGVRILVIERGGWPHRDDEDWDPQSILIKGRYAQPDATSLRESESSPPAETFLSENVGGMSVFYGGATFRLREKDFARWPISYTDLAPFYDSAEALLEVHGRRGEDPFAPPMAKDYPYPAPPLSPPAERIFRAAKDLGFRPFPIPLAINFKNPASPLCIQCQTCDGFPCKRQAKNEATTILAKAQKLGSVTIVTDTLVDRVHEEQGRVTKLDFVLKKDGTRHSVAAKLFVISAGSIGSAGILLRSGFQERFPHGRFIGKHLMRHANGIVSAIFPFRTNPNKEFHKQVAVSHFYEDFRERDGYATGLIQDIYTPHPKVMVHFGPRGLSWLGAAASPWIQNLLCVAEDEPQERNQVRLSGDLDSFGIRKIEIIHAYSEADQRRRNYLMEKAKRILNQAGGIECHRLMIETFSHALGTARSGQSDQTAVLNPHCQFYGIKNLYVVDGSFMPTSGGVNPSLTITANSLRVAEHLVREKNQWV